MPEYVPLPQAENVPSPDDLQQLAFAYMADRVPGWVPTEGMPEARLIEAVALMAYEVAVLTGAVPSAIFRYFGRSILELPSIDPSSASVDGVVTMKDNAGYTLPAGTIFGLRRTGDQLYAFRVAQDVIVPPGSTTGPVTLVAVLTGLDTSGLTGPVEFIDAVSYVARTVTAGVEYASISLNSVTTSGVDGESDADYQDRLRTELTTLAPRLILPADAEIFARRIPGVARAVALDGLNPDDGSTNNARYLTVAVVDAAGEAVSSLVKAAVDADLQARREATFIVRVIDPTYTTLDVRFTAVTFQGFDPVTVQAAAVAAVQSYLSPATWGQTPYGQQQDWKQQTSVRYWELIAVLNSVAGLNYVTSLTVGKRQMVTASASTDVFTATGHGFVVDEPVTFAGITGGAPIVAGTTYYARTITTNTFQIAATPGGAAIDITTNLTAGTVTGYTSNTDIPLAGYAPLPRSGSVSGTVTAP
ncbi:MAG: hypothetical protein JWM31_2843 [Solirubrobacterales bacterium]|nr:hypothetical protein [Solirubrobacterales bacterium]